MVLLRGRAPSSAVVVKGEREVVVVVVVGWLVGVVGGVVWLLVLVYKNYIHTYKMNE